jgi:acyl-CoA synthetase (AMP-forming)/AMP-acid ligase II
MSGYFEDQRLKIKDWQAGLQSSIFNPSTGSGQVLQSSFSFEDQRTKIKDWTPDTHQSSIFNLQSSFSTGDIGYLDEDGDLWLVQRRTDLIVSGGENVYPAEVEKALRGHTAVAQACVVGIPDAEWGQKVAAMVQLRPGTAVTEAELVSFCREHLAGYKIPRLIRFTDTLPQTASGKIARSEAAAQLAGE